MKNILVPIDFDQSIQVLTDKAFELAAAFDSKIWLIHITAPEPDFVGYDVGPQYIRDFRADELRKEHKLLQEQANALNEKGVRTEGILIQGATIEMVLLEAKKLNIDLIIAGHHERSLLYQAFFGSTASDILKKSKIPVLIVPLN